MRDFLLKTVAPGDPPDIEWTGAEADDEQQKAIARRALVLAEGPKCSAWLVRRFKKQFVSKGAVRFERWSKQIPKMWFSVAMSFLSERAGWEVQESWERRGRSKKPVLQVFTVKWINRGHFRATLQGMRNPA